MLWLLIDIIRHPLTDIIDYAAGNIDYAICHSILRYYRLRHVSFYCSLVYVHGCKNKGIVCIIISKNRCKGECNDQTKDL